MQSKWKIRDLIDLEFFLDGTDRDSSGSRPDADFDRQTYLSITQSDSKTLPRRKLIRFWLDRRRQLERETRGQETVLPGTAYSETIALLRVIAAILGGLSGAALVWGLFSYQGRQPINVFTCLWVLVAPQILLLLFLFVSRVFIRFGFIDSFRRIPSVLAALSRRLILRIIRIFSTKTTADTQQRIRSAVGLLGQTRTVYGSVFYWPFFLTAQLFGIMFNLGILSAMLIRVTITDLAFGWQSTLRLDPETVYNIVRAISTPWTWLVSPPIAHPTLTQIAGSKMVLKEGIYRLATQDLIAWWPFLLFTVAFYGLMPRLVLAFLGWRGKRRALDALEFNHTACDRLVQRMQTPRVETGSRPYEKPVPVVPAAGQVPRERLVTPETPSRTAAIALISEDIMERTEPAEINGYLNYCLAMDAVEILSVTIDAEDDASLLESALSAHGNPEDGLRIVIVQEAWQPPIKETISWLDSLRRTVGKKMGIVIALIGKPASGTIFTPPADTDRLIWEQAVKSLGDPYMRVETLGG